MPSGKLAAQAGHAFVEALLSTHSSDLRRFAAYRSDGLGTKVVLQARSEDDLVRAYEHVRSAGIPTVVIRDSGHVFPPFFDGSEIVTAVGIGPATRSEIQHVTGRFALVR